MEEFKKAENLISPENSLLKNKYIKKSIFLETKATNPNATSIVKNDEKIDVLKEKIKKKQDEKEYSMDPEKRKEVILVFNKLKEILNRKSTRKNVKELLIDANISAVLAGIKPTSEITFYKEKKILFSVTEEGLSEKDMLQFQNIIKEFNAKSTVRQYGNNDPYHLDIYINENVVKAMQGSESFTKEEIDLAKKDYSLLYENILESAKRKDFESAYRIGYLYGYPKEDVKGHIDNHIVTEKYKQRGLSDKEIENISKNTDLIPEKIEPADLEIIRKKTTAVHIRGIKNVIPWASYYPESQNVKNKIKDYETVFKLEQEILNS